MLFVNVDMADSLIVCPIYTVISSRAWSDLKAEWCYNVESKKHLNQWWLHILINTQNVRRAPSHLYELRYGTFSNISPT